MHKETSTTPLLARSAGSYGSSHQEGQNGDVESTPPDNANNQALENWQIFMCSITFAPACVALLWLCCLVHGHVMPSSNSTNAMLFNDTFSLRQPPF